MKKTTILFLLALCMTIGLSAFEKGVKSIGGSISLSSTKISEGSPSINSLTITPTLSYFIIDNLSIDLAPGLYYAWSKDEEDVSGFSLGLGATWFIKKFYLGGGFQYSKIGVSGAKASSQELTLKAGYLFNIAQNIYLNTGLAYEKGVGKTKHGTMSFDNDRSSLRAQAGVSIFFK